MADEKKHLLGKTLFELKEMAASLDMPTFAAKQIADWLYKKKITTIDMMSNLSAANRTKLAENYTVGIKKPIKTSLSKDGTKKYLFDVGNNKYIESVFIPEKERATLCVSSQKGCQMNCLFCATGKQSFAGNLTSAEIINQVQSIDECDKLTNIVFMGMGEPMNNINEVLKAIEILTSDYGYGWSPKRITLSTIGVLPALKTFLDSTQCNLAVSIHAPDAFKRVQIIPGEKAYPIKDVLKLLKEYDWSHQRRVSFEYILFNQLNDTEEDALKLADLLQGLDCRVNLIPFHQIPDVDLSPSKRDVMEKFQAILEKKHITATIRKSRGQDIDAACGMLSTKKTNKTL